MNAASRPGRPAEAIIEAPPIMSTTYIRDSKNDLIHTLLIIPRGLSIILSRTWPEKIEREIAMTDEKIDEIVYGLYGVTEEERKIVEGGE